MCYHEQITVLRHPSSLGFIDGRLHSVSNILSAWKGTTDKTSSDIVLWLTYFFKSNELPTRLAWFWTALSFCNIFGSFLAAGILQMRGLNGWGGWQYLWVWHIRETWL